MRSTRQAWLWGTAGSLGVLVLLALASVATAQASFTVRLDAVGGSGVTGTAILIPEGDGTQVVLDVSGLAPDANVRATMHGGSCAIPSASFATLPNLTPDAEGRVVASGWVRFRGTEDVALETMADGGHVIAVQIESMVACGVIPRLASAPAQLPATGQVASLAIVAVAGTVGLSVAPLCAWLLFRRRAA